MMPSISRALRPASSLSDLRPGSSRSGSTTATRRQKYYIVNREGREVEPCELGNYGLRIELDVDGDGSNDFAERAGTDRMPGAQQHLEHLDNLEHAEGLIPPAPPNTVESKKVAGRGSKNVEKDDPELRGAHSSSPTFSVANPSPLGDPVVDRLESELGPFKPTLLFTSVRPPGDSDSSPDNAELHFSNPDHQYLANHRVSSYTYIASDSLEEEQEDTSFMEPNHQQVQSMSLHSTADERESHHVLSRPTTPLAQTDSTTGGANTALEPFQGLKLVHTKDPHDVFVEELREAAMRGAQLFNYSGYVAGSNESCIDLTHYVWQTGVNHGLDFARKIGPANLGRPEHTCGGACDEVRKMRKELEKEKNNVKWEKWNVWAEKDKIKKLTMKHEVQVKMLADDNAELKDEIEALKSEKEMLQGDKDMLMQEKDEQERRLLLLMEQDHDNRARLNGLIMSMATTNIE